MALGSFEKALFERSLDPRFYNKFARPMMAAVFMKDYERIHRYALDAMHRNIGVLRKYEKEFRVPPNLRTSLGHLRIAPYGVAAGTDKDFRALAPLSYVAGYIVPGTVTVNARKGNPRPRLDVDYKSRTVYNNLGFPSEGLDGPVQRLRDYHERSAKKVPLIASFCGIPERGDLENALYENEILVSALSPYVQGLEWDPASPNTETLRRLQTPETFAMVGRSMSRLAPSRLRFVKMPPYRTEEERSMVMALVKAAVENGFHGITLVNTLPENYMRFPTGKAGVSGEPLFEYMLRALKDTRERFPDILIRVCGGIDSGRKLYEAFFNGADSAEGYSPLIFNGLGIIPAMYKELESHLINNGYMTLDELRHRRRRQVKSAA